MLASASSVSKERQEFVSLVNKEVRCEFLKWGQRDNYHTEDLALKEMIGPTAREEEMIEAKQHDQQQLCNISRALAVLASASSVSKERQEFLSLVNKEIKLYNSMLEREDTEGAEEAKKAYMAAREESDDITEVASEEKVLSALIDKVDAMLECFRN